MITEVIGGTITLTHIGSRVVAHCQCEQFAAGGPYSYVTSKAQDHLKKCELGDAA